MTCPLNKNNKNNVAFSHVPPLFYSKQNQCFYGGLNKNTELTNRLQPEQLVSEKNDVSLLVTFRLQ